MAGEVIGAEVAVRDAVAQHVEAGAEHRRGDGEDGLLRTAARLQPQERGLQVRAFRSRARPCGGHHGGLEPWSALSDAGGAAFPALSSLRGQSPAHETRCAALGKRVISTPISATITWA